VIKHSFSEFCLQEIVEKLCGLFIVEERKDSAHVCSKGVIDLTVEIPHETVNKPRQLFLNDSFMFTNYPHFAVVSYAGFRLCRYLNCLCLLLCNLRRWSLLLLLCCFLFNFFTERLLLCCFRLCSLNLFVCNWWHFLFNFFINLFLQLVQNCFRSKDGLVREENFEGVTIIDT